MTFFQSTNFKIGHQIRLDDEYISIKSPMLQPKSFNGWLVIAGFPNQFVLEQKAELAVVDGYRGCLSNLVVNNNNIDMFTDQIESRDMGKGCVAPDVKCSKDLCQNSGECHQGWHGIFCDCTRTAHSGKYCEQPATTYDFDGQKSMIYYEFLAQKPNSVNDDLVLAFRTTANNGVLFSVYCAVDVDYLTVFVGGGYVQVRYNMGSSDHHVGYFDTFVNDGQMHLLKMNRKHTNMTLQLDKMEPIEYHAASK